MSNGKIDSQVWDVLRSAWFEADSNESGFRTLALWLCEIELASRDMEDPEMFRRFVGLATRPIQSSLAYVDGGRGGVDWPRVHAAIESLDVGSLKHLHLEMIKSTGDPSSSQGDSGDVPGDTPDVVPVDEVADGLA